MYNISIKYAIGDRVKFKYSSKYYNKVNCACCDGTGTIIGRDQKKHKCPECEGQGFVEEEFCDTKEFTGVIKDIQVYVFGEKNPKPSHILYRMKDWDWSQTWIHEDQVIGLIS